MAVKTSTLAIVGLLIVVLALATGYVSFNGSTVKVGTTPPPTSTTLSQSIPLTLNVPFFIFNGTQVTASSSCPQALLFANPVSTGTFVGSSSSGAAITGNVIPSQPYDLLIAPASAGTYGTLDNMVASSGNGVTLGSPSVVSYQGSYFTEYPVDFSQLAKISTGVTASVNLYGYTAETPTLTSLLNSTAAPSAGVGSASATCYFSGWAGSDYGQGYKITRMQLLVGYNVTSASPVALPSQAANATAYDNGQLALSSVVIGTGNGQTITTSNNLWGGTSTSVVEIGSASGAPYIAGPVVNQQYYGLPILYGQSDSASGTLTINLNFKSNALGSNTIFFALKIYYITPTGTISSTACPISIS